MPTSRFLKKKTRILEVEDVARASVPSKRVNSVNTPELDTRLEILKSVKQQRSANDAQLKLSKEKDEEFVNRMNKRLNNLTLSFSSNKSSGSSRSLGTSPNVTYAGRFDLEVHQPRREPVEYASPIRASLYDRSLDLPRPNYSSPTFYSHVTHLPDPDLARPRIPSLENRKLVSDRVVREFLLERQSAKKPVSIDVEDDTSDVVHSLWKLLHAMEHSRLDYVPHWQPRTVERQELDDFSTGIGRFGISTGRWEQPDGRDFWNRVATCKGEYAKLQHLVNHTFDRKYEHGWPAQAHSSPELKLFPTAEHAISWARQHRLGIAHV